MEAAPEQRLIFAVPARSLKQETVSVGLVHQLESPFNLFLNLKQLIDPDSRLVYFFIYSIGERKIILWGIYDKYNQSFHIDSACRYRGPQLYAITMQWLKSGYNYVGNTVINRPLELLSKMIEQPHLSPEQLSERREALAGLKGGLAQLGSQAAAGPRISYAEYVQSKYLLAVLKGESTEEEYLRRYHSVPQLPEDPYELDEYAFDLEKELQKYEKGINRTDLNVSLENRLARPVRETLEKIMRQFNEAVAKGAISTKGYESTLQQCPDLQECSKNLTEGCSVYFYGDPELGLLYPEDIRALH